MSQASREGRKRCEADGMPQLSKVKRGVGSKTPRMAEVGRSLLHPNVNLGGLEDI